ncbi:hypothetical protein [Cohnella rhizosphaerae]|uniref:Cyclic nucleotide-binding domain-containing protein n=1 Tax=Cohnella rhizosphaerae TaxID=1457232 RepID=A0A9X4QWM7_9BACL|nr:hypothetical protein [Cohnella rhizosphaerae]MDG0813824.1 hypothetical protein [Cohnella rhizosphaerae]
MNLTGSLYIAPGVGDGEVTIEGSDVGGTVYVLGGGAHTVVLKNTKAARLVVDKPSGEIRVKLEGDTRIANVEFASGGQLENGSTQPVGIVVIKAKPSDTVQWKGDATELTFVSGLSFGSGAGHIAKFTADAGLKNAKIEFAADLAVDTFTANGPVQVTGDGKIATAVINAEGVELSKAPGLLTLNAKSAKIAGETKTSGGAAGGTGGNGGVVDLSTKLYSYAEAASQLGSTKAELQVKQYIAFLQDPSYKPSVANAATAVPDLTNATTFVNASFDVKPSIFASLRGVNTSVLDASRTWLWLGTNDGVTRVRLADNEMKSYTLASKDLKDDKVLLLISDGGMGVYAITETGVSHIQQ